MRFGIVCKHFKEVGNIERLTAQQFEKFRSFIYAKCGVRIDEKKIAFLSNRIGKRLRRGGYEDFDVYYRHLLSRQGESELTYFIDAITTRETYFFRTEKHFDWLSQEYLAELIAQHRAGEREASLRLWSAGCSSGAEPYSLAICLAENRYRLRDWSLEVLGTDISKEALQAAGDGEFNERMMKAVTDRQRRRFFRYSESEQTWKVRPEIRELVEFKYHNLIAPIREEPFDCIFIRNVLIYFDEKSKQVALRNMLHQLAVGGYLIVGPSEGVYDMLGSLEKRTTFLYQKVNA